MSERVAAVVLAAGMSKRMGRPKALLPLAGEPMIVRVVEPLLAITSVDAIVVVTGHFSEQVIGAMDGCDVEFAHNSEFESGGMLSSVKVGCRAVAGRCDVFFLCLGDQPLVSSRTYAMLLESRWSEAPADTPWRSERRFAPSRLTQPSHNGRRGHPILLSSDCIDDVLALPGDATLKIFTQRINTRQIPVDDPGVVTDIDTPQDYERALLEFRAHRSEPCPSKV